MYAVGTQHILRCTPSYAENFQFHRNVSWPSSGEGVRSGSGSYNRWAIGVKVSRVLGERCLQCKTLAESFDCWKWVNYFLVAVQLIGAGTWRPEDPDFWMCVRLSLCVCVSVSICFFFCFILYCFYTNLALYFRRSLCADRKRNLEFRKTVTKRGAIQNGRSRTRWVYSGIATAGGTKMLQL